MNILGAGPSDETIEREIIKSLRIDPDAEDIESCHQLLAEIKTETLSIGGGEQSMIQRLNQEDKPNNDRGKQGRLLDRTL